MCTMPSQSTADVLTFALATNLQTFKEENEPTSLICTLDELMQSHLSSVQQDGDGFQNVSNVFYDYRKIRELLQML
jgi:hypothetical protein